ncbi:MAG TPA: HlyD family efflux transporter periplasmic adaptor subunit [Pyrinomonadaceae bacterium]|nr:HlyD family efflux transporter periplasmic adaptor subunit [Pyrinomonadaceae bacterium]
MNRNPSIWRSWHSTKAGGTSGVTVTTSTLLFTLLLLSSLTAAACGRTTENGNANDDNVIVVNAPATGVVKRILVAEGVRVNAGTPIIEITTQAEGPVVGQKPVESAEGQAVRKYKTADTEIEAARAEAVRHEAEVARLTPLVASGEASQGQLDGERGLYEQAQRRLQQAQEAKRIAEGGLIAARQPGQVQGNKRPAIQETVVPAITTSPGIVSVIGVRVGEQVKAGQALATLRDE